MMAQRTTLVAADLPDSLAGLRSEMGAWFRTAGPTTAARAIAARGTTMPKAIGETIPEAVGSGLTDVFEKHPKLRKAWTLERAFSHLGTLGTGNTSSSSARRGGHGVGMLHSGSRGIGNRIGTYFIERAKEEMRRWFVNLPDADLAYLPQGSELFDDYRRAVEWAQRFAALNRRYMMDAAIGALRSAVPKPFRRGGGDGGERHHNTCRGSITSAKNVIVTRKGAVRAREGELGIIPGSMGARSFIVRGKGNAESFARAATVRAAMSRGEAKRRFTVDDHIKATQGIECRKDADVIDEIRAPTRTIDAVMAAQSDLSTSCTRCVRCCASKARFRPTGEGRSVGSALVPISALRRCWA